MLAGTMPSAAAQAMRACGRTLPAVKSLTATNAASRALLSRRTYLITPGYKARIAVRGYATATATKTKPSAAAVAAKRKPAAKKAPVKAKATTTKKPVKAKAKPKKKKAVAKPKKKPGRKPKAKEPTIAERKRELKKVALYNKEPAQLPISSWTVYTVDRFKNDSGADIPFGERIKAYSADFKNLSAPEKSRLEQKSQENQAINAVNHKKWVESHTVQEIMAANNARLMYKRKYGGKGTKHFAKIQDERAPARVNSAFSSYVKAQLSGVSDAVGSMKDVAVRWKGLSDAEKKPYTDLQLASKASVQKQRAALGLST